MPHKPPPSRAVVPGLGARVRGRRVELGLSQRDLADLCAKHGAPIGYARVAFIEAENHRGGVTAPTLKALARALNLSADFLLCTTDDPTPPE